MRGGVLPGEVRDPGRVHDVRIVCAPSGEGMRANLRSVTAVSIKIEPYAIVEGSEPTQKTCAGR